MNLTIISSLCVYLYCLTFYRLDDKNVIVIIVYHSTPILFLLVAGISEVVSALALISIVNVHSAQLVIGWMTVCGQINHRRV